MMGLPFELLSIAAVIIILPIIIAPIQYRSAKERFGALQQAGTTLKEIEATLDEQHITSGLASYIFLIFDVLRPADTLDDLASKNEIEDVRGHLSNLTRKVITEVIFQGVLFTFLIINFLIPEFITGGALLFPLIFFVFVIAVLILRWFVFFYWRILVRRWLRFYDGFIAWGEELEKMVSSGLTDSDGREP